MSGHFTHSLTVNFDSNALVRFQKSEMYMANGRPSDNNNLSVDAISVLGFYVMIKPLCELFTNVTTYRFHITIHYSNNKCITGISQMQHLTYFNTLNRSTFTECIYRVSSIWQFSWDVLIMLAYIVWNISLTRWYGFCSTSVFMFIAN